MSGDPGQQNNPEIPKEPSNEFFIVGIGASAGGLAAFEKLFTHMPVDAGIAFVVIQHLGKDQKSVLPEIIQRYTSMPVFRVSDGIEVNPNQVYIIPPGYDLFLLDGHLFLKNPDEGKGYRLPIDRFFRSLAQVQGPRAIGIVLSGTLNDGSHGISYVKNENGLTIAQDPDTAEYDGMPRSAIATNDVDFILPPEKMGEMILKYIQHEPLSQYKRGSEKFAVPDESLQSLFFLIRSSTGHDFSQYKKNTLLRRISRRMRVCLVNTLDEYFKVLQERPEEIEALVQELLINVTQFFRDPEAFQALNEQVLQPLIQQRLTGQEPLRIWIPGCSSGEEAYSLAILIEEQREQHQAYFPVLIFATDIDEDSIAAARRGLFADGGVEDVSPERLLRFFTKEDSGYKISKKIRDRVVFSIHNVISDPPFSRIDLLCCRNLLIYLEGGLQRQLLERFHYSLNPGGFLFLGSSESTGKAADLFDTLDRKQKIYRRKDNPQTDRFQPQPGPAHPVTPPPPEQDTPPIRSQSTSLRKWVEQELVSNHTPACIVIDERHNIIYIHGRTGKYLELPTGEPNSNLVLLAREGLKTPLATALHTASTTRASVRQEAVQVKTEGGSQPVTLTVQPVGSLPGFSGLLMVLFEDAVVVPGPLNQEASPQQVDQRLELMEKNLVEKDEYLDAVIDELEKTNQDLKAVNEELQSYNEEIQSANEELETSKEEVQSINEELTTINTELQYKNEELSRTNNDIHNLLDSTEIATLLLDLELRVRRFTPPTQAILDLIPTDSGRPIDHFKLKLDYDQFVQDIRTVLRTLEAKTVEARSPGEKIYLIKITPYRTLERVVDGVVVTFVDVTQQKRTDELRRLATILRDSNDAITQQDFQGQILAWNRGAVQMYGWSEAEALQMNVIDLTPQANMAETVELYRRLARGEMIRSYETQRVRRDGRIIDVWMTLTALLDNEQRPMGVATTERDITQRRLAQQSLEFENRALLALSQWFQTLAARQDTEALLDEACQLLIEPAGYRLAWIGRVEPGRGAAVRPVTWCAAGDPGEVELGVQRLAETSRREVQNALRTQQPVVSRAASRSAEPPGEDLLSLLDVQSFILLPLLNHTPPGGVLAIYAAEPEAFTGREAQHLSRLASSLAQQAARLWKEE